MTVRDLYWRTLGEMKYAELYFQLYAVRSNRIRKAISAVCLLSSLACVAAWAESDGSGVLWAALIAAAQLISALQPLFPYEERVTAAGYIYKDLSILVIEVESDWLFIANGISLHNDDNQDERIAIRISDFRQRQLEIENKYAGVGTFPFNERLSKKARRIVEGYLRRYQDATRITTESQSKEDKNATSESQSEKDKNATFES